MFGELKYFLFGQKCIMVLVLCLFIVFIIFRLVVFLLLVNLMWCILLLCLMNIFSFFDRVLIIDMLMLCRLLENWQFLLENLLLVCSVVRIIFISGFFCIGCGFMGMLWLLFFIFMLLFLSRVMWMFLVCLVSVLFMELFIIFWIRWLGWLVLVYIFGCLCIGFRFERILIFLEVQVLVINF